MAKKRWNLLTEPNSIFWVKFWSFIKAVGMESAQLEAPKSFSCEQTPINVVLTFINNFFHHNEFKVRHQVFNPIEMHG